MPIKTDQSDALKEDYANWLKYPDSTARRAAGEPTSKSEWAKKYGVNRTTIWRWEQDNEFKRMVYEQNLGMLSTDDIHKIMAALKGKAFSGNVQAAKLLLEWSGLKGGMLKPTPDEFDATMLSAMSDEELDSLGN